MHKLELNLSSLSSKMNKHPAINRVYITTCRCGRGSVFYLIYKVDGVAL